jgi:hypothetical protein
VHRHEQSRTYQVNDLGLSTLAIDVNVDHLPAVLAVLPLEVVERNDVVGRRVHFATSTTAILRQYLALIFHVFEKVVRTGQQRSR